MSSRELVVKKNKINYLTYDINDLKKVNAVVDDIYSKFRHRPDVINIDQNGAISLTYQMSLGTLKISYMLENLII